MYSKGCIYPKKEPTRFSFFFFQLGVGEGKFDKVILNSFEKASWKMITKVEELALMDI